METPHVSGGAALLKAAAAVVLGCELCNCRNLKWGVAEQEHTCSANPLSWINKGKKRLTDMTVASIRDVTEYLLYT